VEETPVLHDCCATAYQETAAVMRPDNLNMIVSARNASMTATVIQQWHRATVINMRAESLSALSDVFCLVSVPLLHLYESRVCGTVAFRTHSASPRAMADGSRLSVLTAMAADGRMTVWSVLPGPNNVPYYPQWFRIGPSKYAYEYHWQFGTVWRCDRKADDHPTTGPSDKLWLIKMVVPRREGFSWVAVHAPEDVTNEAALLADNRFVFGSNDEHVLEPGWHPWSWFNAKTTEWEEFRYPFETTILP
jgi:hypothetical protein